MNDINFSDYKFKIIENIDDENLLDMFNVNNVVYVKPGTYAMSTRKLESLIKIAYIQKYYQCNPVRFIDDFFNIELLDAQAYVVQRTWNCPNVLVLASRGFGKSTVIDLILHSLAIPRRYLIKLQVTLSFNNSLALSPEIISSLITGLGPFTLSIKSPFP